MRKLVLAATGLAALAVPAIAPVMASAAPSASQTYSVVTHSAQHADTTDTAGPGTKDSPNGPVWAYDNMNLKYVVTTLQPGHYSVAIQATGSFDAFANPNTGDFYTGTGSVKGNITYTVDSPTPPDTTQVPSQEPNGSSIRLPIKQMFGLDPANPASDSSIVQSGGYMFTYNKVDGVVYTQH